MKSKLLVAVAATAFMVTGFTAQAAEFTTTTVQSDSVHGFNTNIYQPGDVFPSAGNTYRALSGAVLRTPASLADATFDGDRLTLDTGAILRFKAANNGIVTIPEIVMNGGRFHQGNGNNVAILRGTRMLVTANSEFEMAESGNRTFVFELPLEGTGNLRIYNQNRSNNDAHNRGTVFLMRDNSNFSGDWILDSLPGSGGGGPERRLASAILRAMAPNSVGSGNVVINDLSVFEVGYNWWTEGTVTINGAGTFTLHQDVVVAGLTINGTVFPPGRYTYKQLNKSFPNNFQFLDYGFDLNVGDRSGNAGGGGSITVFPLDEAPWIERDLADQVISVGDNATFEVSAFGRGLTYEWTTNGVVDPSVTGPVYAITGATPDLNGMTLQVTITTAQGVSASSALATLTVTTAPILAAASNYGGLDFVLLTFSKEVDSVSAGTLANYSIDQGVSISAVTVSSENKVYLTTSPLTYGTTYTVTVQNVTDTEVAPQTIVPNPATITFTAAPFGNGYFKTDFENGLPAGTTLYTSGQGRVEPFGRNNNALLLTENVNSQWSTWIIGDLGLGTNTVSEMSVRFRYTAGRGTYRPADGFCFSFGPDLPNGNPGGAEDGMSAQGINITVDFYNSTGNEAPAVGVEIKNAFAADRFVGIIPIKTYPTFVDVRFDLTADGKATLWFGDILVCENLQTTYTPIAGRFGLGARTGGLNSYQYVDDVEVFVNQQVPPEPVSIVTPPASVAVIERESATFTVEATGGTPWSYQWLENGVEIPGATASSYTIPSTSLAQNGNQYSVVVENFIGEVESAAATLTVDVDAVPPQLVSARADAVPNRVIVTLSEPIKEDPVIDGLLQDGFNYELLDASLVPLSVASGTILPGRTVLSLDVDLLTPLVPGATYTLRIPDAVAVQVLDRSNNPLVTPAASAPFTAWHALPGLSRWEVWDNVIGPNAVATVTGLPTYPYQPNWIWVTNESQFGTSGGLEAPVWQFPNMENYGARMVTWVIPPATGNYTIRTISDDASIVWLSSDASPANKRLVYDELGCCAAHDTGPWSLVAGQAYYMEGILKEGTGGDYLQVFWEQPSTATVGSEVYSGRLIEFAATGMASAELVDGGRALADPGDGSWAGKIVLVERGDASFFAKTMNVQNAGGVACIIYNNAPGGFSGTLGVGNTSLIPAISLSQEDGQFLLNNRLGQVVEVNAILPAFNLIRDANLVLAADPTWYQISSPPPLLQALENSTVHLTVSVQNVNPEYPTANPLGFQWQYSGDGITFIDLVDGFTISGATTATLTISPAGIIDEGFYRCVVSMGAGLWTMNSDTTQLTTVQDIFPPELVSAQGVVNKILLTFDEPVFQPDAEDITNYALDNGAQVLQAILQTDGQSVVLLTSALEPVTAYTLTVQNIRDVSFDQNPIPPGTTIGFSTPAYFYGLAKREQYNDIGGGSIANNLLLSPKFPDSPDVVDFRTILETDTNIRDDYGTRLSTWFVPNQTGNWVFYSAVDDDTRIYLSTDFDPANKTMIAEKVGWTGPRLWTGAAISAPIPLIAGEPYYLEVLGAEGAGGDNLAVLAVPEGTIVADLDPPTAGELFMYIGYPTAGTTTLTIDQQPTDVITTAGQFATFTVAATATDPDVKYYQWQSMNPIDMVWTNIPGATSASFTTPRLDEFLDNDRQFRCVVMNPFGSLAQVFSASARLTVGADDVVPTVLAVHSGPLPHQVFVTFSEPMEPFSATDNFNYSLHASDGSTGIGLQPDIDIVIFNGDQTVVLTWVGQVYELDPNLTYTLEINGPQDPGFNQVFGYVSPPFTRWYSLPGQIQRQIFFGDDGPNNFQTTYANPRFPYNPSSVDYLAEANSPEDSVNPLNGGVEAEHYSQRFVGYIVPPETANYRFQGHADDSAAIWISPTVFPGDKVNILNSQGDCGACGSPQSAVTVPLIGGVPYYIEGLMQEGTGGDYFDIAWMNDASIGAMTIIPGANLIFAVPPGSATFELDPQDVTISDGLAATFTAGFSPYALPANLRWQRFDGVDFVDIPNAFGPTYTTPYLAIGTDNGAQYRCVAISASYGEVPSAAAMVTITADTEAPVLLGANGQSDYLGFSMRFSERIDPASLATAIVNISGGVTVLSLELLADEKTVRALTTVQLSGGEYAIEVTGITDASENHNPVVPNSMATYINKIFIPGIVKVELYSGTPQNIGGGSVDNLFAHPSYPNFPTRTAYLTQMYYRPNVNNYGAVLSGWFVPARSGWYKFYLGSDDESKAWLSPGAERPDFSAGSPDYVAHRPSNGGYLNDLPDAQALRYLVAGAAYNLHAIVKEGSGGDFLDVGYQVDGGPISRIQGSIIGQLTDPDPEVSVSITQHPQSVVLNAGDTMTLTGDGVVVPISGLVFYQWVRDGVAIAGATSPTYVLPNVAVYDDGARFQLLVATIGAAAISSEAVLTVDPVESDPPTMVGVGSIGGRKIGLQFSEVIYGPRALTANYAIIPTGLGLVPVTGFGDIVTGSSGNHPGGETPAMAVDGNLRTKYLNLDGATGPSGFTVQLAAGPQLVKAVRLTTANDTPGRDPQTVVVEGSPDGGATWVELLNSTMFTPGDPALPRGFQHTFDLSANMDVYGTYRVSLTPDLALAAGSMQIAEVELLGVRDPVTITGVEVAGNNAVVLSLSGAIAGEFTVEAEGVGDVSANEMPLSQIMGSVLPFEAMDSTAMVNGSDTDPDPRLQIYWDKLDVPAYSLSVGGSDIWGNADRFAFVYRQVLGDFDVRVRIHDFTWANDWSKAGLMVRAALAAPAKENYMITTPDQGGNRFLATGGRQDEGGGSQDWNAVLGGVNRVEFGPASGKDLPFPNVWLRLRRDGGLLSCYYSTDGVNWGFMNAEYDEYPAARPVFVGQATTSHQQGTPSTVTFSDLQVTLVISNGNMTVQPPVNEGDIVFFNLPGRQINPAYEFEIVTPPAGGVATLAGEEITYEAPAVGTFIGAADTFTYRARLGDMVTETYTVTIPISTIKPTLVEAIGSTGYQGVLVRFNGAIDPTSVPTATFAIDNGVNVLSQTMVGSDSVFLETSLQFPGTTYTVAVSGIFRDALNPATEIEPGSMVSWVNGIFIPGNIKLERYDDIRHTLVGALLSAPNYPDSPSFTTYLSQALYEPNLDNYGAVMSGVFVPPVSGNYKIRLRTDDQGMAWMSWNATPPVLSADSDDLVALRPCCGGYDNILPDPISVRYLVAGQPYFLVAMVKEGGGGDYLDVAYQLNGGADIRITADIWSTYSLSDPGVTLTLTGQPQSVSVLAGQTASFGVTAEVVPQADLVSYQWLRDGAPIVGAYGATLDLPLVSVYDSGAVFQCAVLTPGAFALSDPATLTVDPAEADPPTIFAAGSFDGRKVGIRFNEPIYAPLAANPANFTVQSYLATQLVPITGPGDVITGSSLNYTPGEAPEMAVDGLLRTKYLNFDGPTLETGLTIELGAGPKVVKGVRVTLANDAPERDPAEIIIEGSDDMGANWNPVLDELITPNQARGAQMYFDLSVNTIEFPMYRIRIPTVADPILANSMQIAEIALLGEADPVTITGVAMSGNEAVELTLSAPVVGNCTIEVTGIPDLSGNLMSATPAPANVLGWSVLDSGQMVGGNPANPNPPGQFNWSVYDGDIFGMSVGGDDIWGDHDGMNFIYREWTGDFDVRVRVRNTDPVSRWAKAGLMIRESLHYNSKQHNIVADPRSDQTVPDNANGGANLIESNRRPSLGAGSGEWDNGNRRYDPGVPMPYPNVWVRLRREAGTLTTYGSFDGVNWIELANEPDTYGATVYLGVCTTSHNNGTANNAVYGELDLRFIFPGGDLTAPVITEDESGQVTLPGTDPNLSYELLTGPQFGSASLVGNVLTYTPNPNFNGQDSFTYRIFNSDLGLYSREHVVTVPVAYVDDVRPYAFDAEVRIDTPNTPRAIAAGDFIKDYKQDLAVANMADNKVSILQGDGKGNFALPIEIATGNSPVGVAKLDFNRDYRDDLAVLCAGDQVIQIFQQMPDQTMVLYTNLPVDGANAQSLIAADFNYDIYFDLAVVNTDAGTVQVWMNGKADGFNRTYSYPVGNMPLGIGAGAISWPDIKPEIVAANSGDDTATVLLGLGDGSFTTGVTLPAGSMPTAVLVADFNGNRKGDVIIANGGTDDITCYTNDGRGTLSPAGSFGLGVSLGFKPVALAAADFNYDRKLDLAVLLEGADSVLIMYGNGSASVTDPATPLFAWFYGDPGGFSSVGDQPVGLVSADFNRDVRPDLAVVNYASQDVSILMNNWTPKAYRQLIKVLEDTTHPITLGGSYGPLDYILDKEPSYGTYTTTDSLVNTTVNPVLEYTPSNHWYGWDKITYHVADNAPATVIEPVSYAVKSSRPADILIWVLPVNDPPGFTIDTMEVSAPEDVFLFKYTNFVTKATPVFGEQYQYQKYILTPADPGLFRPIWGVPKIIGTDLQLWFTPPKDAFGSTTVDIYAFDYGGTNNGGINTSTYTNTFTINITPVNDAPKFLDLLPFKVGYEETPTNWFFRIADVDTPLDQIQVSVLSTNTALVDPSDPNQVQITQVVNVESNWLEVTVTVTPAVDEFGKTTLTVMVDDTQGGTASKSAGFLVFGVNDPPSFDLVAGIDPLDMQLGAGYYTKYTNTVVEPTSIAKGPVNENSQYIFFYVTNSNPSLFILQPKINSVTGELSFWAKSSGTVTLDIVLKDTGGTLWGGDNLSPVRTITLNINP